MSDRGTIAVLAEELALALQSLVDTFGEDGALRDLLETLGWDFSAAPAELDGLRVPAEQVVALVQDPGGIADVGELLAAIRTLFEAISGLQSAGGLADDFRNEFPRQLVDYLLVEYLLNNQPRWGYLLMALGILRLQDVPSDGTRPAFLRSVLELEDFSSLLSDPLADLREEYRWGQSDFAGERLLQNIFGLFDAWGVHTREQLVDAMTLSHLTDGALQPDETFESALRLVLFEHSLDPSEFGIGVDLFLLPETAVNEPGVALLPYASTEFDETITLSHRLTIILRGSIDLTTGAGILVRPARDLEFLDNLASGSPSPASGAFSTAIRLENLGPTFVLLGTEDASHFSMAGASSTVGARPGTNGESELFVEFALEGVKIVVRPDPDEVDGFLARILPPDGLQFETDLTIGLSTAEGLYFRGSSGLEIRLPVHLRLGPVELQSALVSIRAGDSGIPIDLAATIKVDLGPLQAVVENIGFTANFTFPSSRDGILGPVDLTFEFRPPNGIGLVLDSGGVKGGGFLRFEPDEQRYSGTLVLEFHDWLSVTAIGLLTTRGEDFSLIIVISTEFTPAQLGFGFTLNGVGGLLGLNRTVRIERLRTGLKDDSLKSILFPSNIVANAARIISDLQQVFPAQAERFVIGPIARIGWGTPTLLTVDLGLIIELPQPVRLIILGRLSALLPDEKLKLLRLRVNFLGVIDLEAQRLSFDASLYDSSLLGYTLVGDMALRFSWGARSNFLLTVGGFHPAYQPPPLGLPALTRLAILLIDSDSATLRLETYFAVTSNTVQFGAKLELRAGGGKFNVHGLLAFDVLFQFSPFRFVADLEAKLALRAWSRSIASIRLTMTLEGPTPWHAKGSARLKLFWFLTVKIKFDKTFGEQRQTTFPDILVLPLLRAALRNEQSWRADPPPRRHQLVSFKKITPDPDTILVHPFGVLTVSQKVVPLDVRIERVGNQRPADADTFRIRDVRIGTQSFGTLSTKDQFAPAQYFELTDAAKLSSKSFEEYNAGVRIADSEKLHAVYGVRREVTYELSYIDEQRDALPPRTAWELDGLAFQTWAVNGAVAKSPLSYAASAKSALATGAVKVAQEQYAVVSTIDLKPVNGFVFAASEWEATSQMKQMLANDPSLDGEVQVVPSYEVNSV